MSIFNWIDFADTIKYTQFILPNEEAQKLVSTCFKMEGINYQNLAVSALSFVKLNHFAIDELMIDLLKKTIIADEEFERFITQLRKEVLFGKKIDAALLYAIAIHCFYNEYIYEESEEESEKIEQLKMETPLEIALLGCYRPLHTFSFFCTCQDENFLELIRIQVDEPLQEKALIETIPSLKPIENPTSHLVRMQYEENPYPRWSYVNKRESKTLSQFVQKRFPDCKESFASKPQILVAGSGTGKEAIDLANSIEDANILAIDLSLASLAYAKRKHAGIQWMQADILDLHKLGRSFDFIECCGVLHHLQDPFEGWRTLREHLREGGLMVISLYSEKGREDVVRAKKVLQGVHDLKEARRMLFEKRDPHLKGLLQTVDFYTQSSVRDLLFHAQEHRFNLLQISQMIQRLGLKLIGIEQEPNVLKRYAELFPGVSHSLENWHQFEELYPETFIGMYHLWLTTNE